tara:strand:+ start:310 stop:540 length:231 start_codon:yes stop_codon:yes gene_type:complete
MAIQTWQEITNKYLSGKELTTGDKIDYYLAKAEHFQRNKGDNILRSLNKAHEALRQSDPLINSVHVDLSRLATETA